MTWLFGGDKLFNDTVIAWCLLKLTTLAKSLIMFIYDK